MTTLAHHPSKEYLGRHFKFDSERGRLLVKERRGSNNCKKVGEDACSNSNGYRAVRVFNKLHYEHHLVWWMSGLEVPPGFELDHINGVKTDNRLSNLRLASRSENLQNVGVRSDNTSGIKGVRRCVDKRHGYPSWVAEIRASGTTKSKRFSVGKYGEEEAKNMAIAFRSKWETQLHTHRLQTGITATSDAGPVFMVQK